MDTDARNKSVPDPSARFDLPPLFDARVMRVLVQRGYDAARTIGERRLFASILRRAREDVLEIEVLYRELPGVFAGDRAATRNFHRVLGDAHAAGVGVPPSPVAMRRLSGFIPGGDFYPCDPPFVIPRSKIRLIAYGIGCATSGDSGRRDAYVNALRGLWAKGQLLERLYRDAIDGDGHRNRIGERLRGIARDLESRWPGLEPPHVPGEGGLPGGPMFPPPEDGPFPWPGPDDGPPIPWPPDNPPGGPGLPPGLPPGVPPGGPPGSGFDPCNFYDDPCNHLAVVPPTLPRSTRWDNVTSVSPATACPGEQVTVLGHSFGASRPPDISLVIGDQAIDDANIVEWSDTRIVFTVPAGGIKAGCVGFRNATIEGVRKSALVALNQQRGALGACLGTDMVPLPYIEDRPDCTGVNSVAGSFPVIHSFLVNGETDLTVDPGVLLQFTAKVDNADTLLVLRDHPAGPEYANVPNNPAGTIMNVAGLTGTEPKDHVYYLRAVNRCGLANATVKVYLRRRPALSVKAIETVQAIQRCDPSGAPVQEVPLVARHRTVVRAWLDSGLTDGFDYGRGPNTVEVTGELHLLTNPIKVIGHSNGPFPFFAQPPSQVDRKEIGHSLNFVLPWDVLTGNVSMTVKVWGSGKWAKTGPGWAAQATRSATFHPRKKFRVAICLVSNKGMPAPAIINTEFLLDRYPIAEDGLEVLLVPGVFNTSQDFGTDAGWNQLWSDVAEMSEELVHDYDALIGLFHKHPSDSLGPSMIGGMTKFDDSTMNNKAWPPVAIAYLEPPVNGVHELVHCHGIGHAACPPGITSVVMINAVDSRLSGVTEDVGVNARTLEVVPKGSAALMGYCPLTGEWPSIALWELLFQVFA